MVTIPPRKCSERRNETRDLARPIEAALNHLPGVWAARNNNGEAVTENGWRIRYGLGTGSPDIIFGVAVAQLIEHDPDAEAPKAIVTLARIERLGWIEVKWPGERLSRDQRTWHAAAHKRGSFVAIAHSVEEAISAVERCRRGKSA